MCAICGIVNFDAADPVDQPTIGRMTAIMAHRGPDDEGFFLDGRVGLGHRRLSIIDLRGGKQPIFNEDESAVIVFNGEIYNYRELTAQLTAAGHVFSTQSDTETILHAYEQYGDRCVERLRGMFAFAVWDRSKQRLLLARDRLGVKPLYYYAGPRFFAFASEIKSLLEIPEAPREVDPEALDLYLSLRYVPGPRTIFKNIYRLQPGCILVLDRKGMRTEQYWDIEYSEPEPHPEKHFLDGFRELLDQSVRLRLLSEVPLGVFLSGGLDSSAILAMMTGAAEGSRVKAFSVGYRGLGRKDAQSNEFGFARLAAEAFVAEHHEYHLSAAEFGDFAPELVWRLDEPMADPSAIPLYFLSRLAREHITVVLSGEGADEILGGYNIYRRMLSLNRLYGTAPSAMSRFAPWAARYTPKGVLRRYVGMSGQPLERRYRGVCRGFTSEWKRRLIGADRGERSEQLLDSIFESRFNAVRYASPLNRMLYVDAKIWLPDDLLIKADKMTMANGVELRVPFLDHKLVEFAAAVPDHLKIGPDGGKSLLRKAMQAVLPDVILHRSKKGFPTPVSCWLRSPLRSFARELLLSSGSACSRYMERRVVEEMMQEHERGKCNRHEEIWTLLVFELWHRTFIDRRIEPSVARKEPPLAVAV